MKNEALNLLGDENEKNRKFVMDKIFHRLDVHFDTNSLSAWLSYYYQVHVKGSPLKTEQAKRSDIEKFKKFFELEVGHDHVDNWTPAVSKQFQKVLCKTIFEKTGKVYKTTTVNRVMATIRHVGRWLHQQRPLLVQ